MKPELLAVPGVKGLTPYQPGKPISELERELGVTNIVKLASNENPLGPSPKALQAITSLLNELHLYPDGGGFELKAALSRRLGVPPAQITLGNGSNDVLDIIGRAFLGPGTAAVFSQHAFAVYPIVTQAVGAESRVAEARYYGHDLAAMAELVDEAVKVVFIANPNNPTGTRLGKAELYEFLQAVAPRCIVVVDEAYIEYTDEPDFPNALDWLAEFENLVVTRTFSKAYGLSGLRVGYALSSPAVADLLNRVRQPFNVNSLALAAATAALGDTDHLARTRSLNQRGMAQLTASFEARGLAYIPSAGNFVTVDVGQPAGPVYQALLREGVIVRPVGNYGMPHHLRVTIGTEAENQMFLDALDRVLA
jgi:histidinol-phosphate aminotransferase